MSKQSDKDLAICARKIKALQDYVDYFVEAEKLSMGFLFAHNWQYPKEFLARGDQLRKAILDANKIDT